MKTILLISNDSTMRMKIADSLMDRYGTVSLDRVNHLFDFCFTTTPDLIVLSADVISEDAAKITSAIKSDPLFGHLPVMAVIDDTEVLKEFHLDTVIDDYIKTPFDSSDLAFRIDLCITRAKKALEINPLTMLPGNVTIIKEIQRRIDSNSVFALAYTDIDYFKPFNDSYGFSRGDEVIRMTGRLITNIIKILSPADGFVGHIGGDDFVFIVSADSAEAVCKELMANFDDIIPSFYDSGDRERGFIESIDREGNKKRFPLLTLSIGVAHNKYRGFSHYGQASEIATEMKRYAKKFKGSCYKMDRRKS